MNFGIVIALINYVGGMGVLGLFTLLLAGAALLWLVVLLVYLFLDKVACRDASPKETSKEKIARISRECDERMR